MERGFGSPLLPSHGKPLSDLATSRQVEQKEEKFTVLRELVVHTVNLDVEVVHLGRRGRRQLLQNTRLWHMLLNLCLSILVLWRGREGGREGGRREGGREGRRLVPTGLATSEMFSENGQWPAVIL